jgi:hypothetical protein
LMPGRIISLSSHRGIRRNLRGCDIIRIPQPLALQPWIQV